MGTRVNVTGGLSISAPTGELTTMNLPGWRARLVLTRLTLSRHPVGADDLADLIWPDGLPARWREELDDIVGDVAARLEEVGLTGTVVSAAGAYELRWPAGTVIDAEEVARLLQEAARALDQGDLARAGPLAGLAVELARRPLLPGDRGPWVTARREERRRLLLRALELRSEVHQQAGETDLGIAAIAEALELEPLRETAHARLIALHASAGNRAEALKAFDRARDRLSRELGIAPSEVLEAARRAVLHHGSERTVAPPEENPSAALEGTVTFLFTDLVRSTELTESLGPEGADRLRRTHFDLLRDGVAGFDVREVKNLGDGLMIAAAKAGVAVRAAVSVQQAMARHNRTAEVPLSVRIGLHAGEPVVDHADYFGLPVTVAKRVCDAAEGGEILVTDVVRALVTTTDGFERPRPLRLKGLSEPVPAWTVAWRPIEARPIPAPRIVRNAATRGPMVGRADLLDELDAALAAARTKAGEARMVEAEPGAGKTRLVTEFARRAGSRGTTVLWGRSRADDASVYAPFIEAFDHVIGHATGDELRIWSGRFARDLGRVFPRLAEQIGDRRPPEDTEPAADRARLFTALAHLVRALAQDRPVLLVLEDLHWADEPSLLILRALLVEKPVTGLLVLGTTRPQPVAPGSCLSEILAGGSSDRRIPLPPLDPVDIADLLPGHLVTDRTELAHAVGRLTGGNPLFVHRLLEDLTVDGVLDERAVLDAERRDRPDRPRRRCRRSGGRPGRPARPPHREPEPHDARDPGRRCRPGSRDPGGRCRTGGGGDHLGRARGARGRRALGPRGGIARLAGGVLVQPRPGAGATAGAHARRAPARAARAGGAPARAP